MNNKNQQLEISKIKYFSHASVLAVIWAVLHGGLALALLMCYTWLMIIIIPCIILMGLICSRSWRQSISSLPTPTIMLMTPGLKRVNFIKELSKS